MDFEVFLTSLLMKFTNETSMYVLLWFAEACLLLSFLRDSCRFYASNS